MRADPRIVDIARDFLAVHGELGRIGSAQRAGSLRFEDVRSFVGDDERSVLFRLKERCHALFRSEAVGAGVEIGPSALFDLAVGSLFHEAMKLRENLYQATVYAPKVEALRGGARDAGGLFAEFDKIVRDARVRLADSVAESTALLRQTALQFRALLRAHADDGVLARFLVSHAEALAEALGETPDAALASLYGTAAAAWQRAAESYLASGFFAEASHALAEATARGADPAVTARKRRYADGMAAYLAGDYARAIDLLSAWADAAPPADELTLVPVAAAALARTPKLAEGDAVAAKRAADLAERLRAALPLRPAEA
jgi:tetratricopeptide (TPR) repeat protein